MNSSFDIGAGLVECCEPTVDPLIFLGILAGVAGLTVFFQQLGRWHSWKTESKPQNKTFKFWSVVANIMGRRKRRSANLGLTKILENLPMNDD